MCGATPIATARNNSCQHHASSDIPIARIKRGTRCLSRNRTVHEVASRMRIAPVNLLNLLVSQPRFSARDFG